MMDDRPRGPFATTRWTMVAEAGGRSNARAATDPARGRFRAFLLTALKRCVINQHQRDRTLRRGGRQRFGGMLRAEIAETVAGEQDVELELRELLRAISS